ncbi:MAG: ATP-binding protein, partial [Burkholderiales bacterium]
GGGLRHQIIDLPARPQAGQPLALEAVVHEHRGIALVEFEPVPAAAGPSDWMQAISDIVDALRGAANLDQLVDTLAKSVKQLSGFDRVMVYRFDESFDGHVIAEAHAPGMEPFLDLHYPASDIPPQARELYRTNLVRYIADTGYRAVPVLSLAHVRDARAAGSDAPLDLSHSMLRSVSPMHVEYLHNMGVDSTLTLSLLVDDRLWGLVVCHHRSATVMPVRLRRACHALSVAAGYMVGFHAQRDHAGATRRFAQLQAQVIAAFNQVDSSLDEVAEAAGPALLLMAGASAGALWRGGQIHPFGAWPGAGRDTERGTSIVRCARDAFVRTGADLFSTEHAELQPAIEASELSQFCGLMALPLGRLGHSGIVWLRPEYRHEVSWGGDPSKPMPVETGVDGRPRIGPRTSFARWEVLVRERCRAWSALEMDAVRTLLPLRQVLATRDAVAQLTRKTARFRALVDLQSDVYWQTDMAGRLVMTSMPPSSGRGPYLGRTLAELVAGCAPEQQDALNAALQARQTFRRLRMDGRRISDNSRYHLFISGAPLLDDGGRFEGWHGTTVDATRDIQMQASLRQKEAAETDKLRAVALLAAGIAHDFNNLLGSINGLAELCELDATAGSRQARNLGRIRQAGDRAALLVRQMLDFSRQTPMAPQRLLASVWLAHADGLLRAALPRHIEFAVTIDADGPVNIDLVQMEQVLLNVTRNAAQAISKQGGAVRLVVDLADPASEPGPASGAATTTPRHLRLRMIDNGTGMSADILAQIFDPFFTTKPVGEGTGLGLAAAHGIVGSHGGVIEARSEPGIGTTFSIFLPLADHAAPEAIKGAA